MRLTIGTLRSIMCRIFFFLLLFLPLPPFLSLSLLSSTLFYHIIPLFLSPRFNLPCRFPFPFPPPPLFHPLPHLPSLLSLPLPFPPFPFPFPPSFSPFPIPPSVLPPHPPYLSHTRIALSSTMAREKAERSCVCLTLPCGREREFTAQYTARR